MKLKVVLILTCLLLVATGTTAQNLVTNGNFETGDFRGWTVSGFFTGCAAVVANGATLPCADPQFVMSVNSGSYAAALLTVYPQDVYLSQALTTVPGASYTIRIYLANCFAGSECVNGNGLSYANHFQVQWNGKVLFDQYGVGSNYGPGNRYSLYTFTVTASGSSTTFAIAGYNAQNWFFLDDIQVFKSLGASPPFTGSTRAANCVGETISALTQKYGGLAEAAAALGYSSASDLQNAVVGYCGR